MPETSQNKTIKYSYTGDVTSLKKAAKDAISVLTKFEGAFQSLAKKGKMNVTAATMKKFSGEVKQAYKNATELHNSLAKMSQNTKITGTVKSTTAAVVKLNQVLKRLQSDSRTSNEAVDKLTQKLVIANQSMTKTSDKVRGVSISLREVTSRTRASKNIIDQWIDANERSRKSAKASAAVFKEQFTQIDKLTKAVKKLRDQKIKYYESLKKHQNDNNLRKPGYNTDKLFTPSKPAEESAQAFMGTSGKILDITDSIAQMFKSGSKAQMSTYALGSKFAGAFSGAGASGAGGVAGVAAAIAAQAAKVVLKIIKEFAKEVTKQSVKLVQDLYKTTAMAIPKTIQYSAEMVSKFWSLVGDVGKTVNNVLSKTPSLLEKVAQVAAGFGLGKMFAEATKSAIDMVETVNLFTVAMKDSLTTGQTFITEVSEMFGLDPTNLQRITGLFYEMGAAVGVPSNAAAKLSTNMSKLALNISSLFNVDIETVADNLTSGLRGMSRAVVKYGMDLRATTVERYTKSLGITEQFETMNEASREVARYLVMVNQARDANEDFSRTLEAPANQLRVFKEQITQLGREIGRVFVTALKDILPIINGIIIAIRLVVEALGNFFGLFKPEYTQGMSKVEDSVGGIGAAAGDAAKNMKQLLAPFDELNILAESASGATSGGIGADDIIDPRLLAELEKTESALGKIRMKAMDTRDAILEFLGLEYNLVIDPETGMTISKLDVIPNQFADRLAKAWKKSDWSAVGSVIAKKLNELVIDSSRKVSWSTVGDKFTYVIKSIADGLNSFISNFSWGELGATLGATLTTIFNSVDTWLDSFDYRNLGSKIADFFNGAISELEVGGIGTTLANWLNRGIQFAVGFEQTFNWEEFKTNLVSSIQNFFSTIQWSEFTTTAVSIVNHLVDALVDFVTTTPWSSVKDAIVSNLTYIFDNMKFVEFFQASLALIGHLVDSLCEFIVSDTVGWTKVKNSVVSAIQWILEEAPYTDLLQTAVALFNHLTDALVKIATTTDWQKAKQSIIQALEFVLNNANIAEFFEAASEIVAHIIDALIEFIDTNRGKFNEIGARIGEALAKIPWGTVLWNAITAAGGAFLSGIKSYINEKITNPRNPYINSGVPDIQGVLNNYANMPKTATGGVVYGPQVRMVGEGLYDEAIIPLGNSPQLEEMLNKFASKVDTVSNTPVEVRVYIGDQEWDAFTYKSAKRGEQIVGVSSIREAR